MAEMTYKEVLAKAQEVFGDGVRLEYDPHVEGWIIRTLVPEKVDLSDFEGTPAIRAYEAPDYGYGSELERWAHKNGQGDKSLYQVAEIYNRHWEIRQRADVDLVRRMVAKNHPFDWDGGTEYRDRMLKLGEERGW